MGCDHVVGTQMQTLDSLLDELEKCKAEAAIMRQRLLKYDAWNKRKLVRATAYYKANKNKVNAWISERRKKDPLFKLKTTCRQRCRAFIKKSGFYKWGKTFNMIGCSPSELKSHLESKFRDGMSWHNHGSRGWHIDHIIPLCQAKTQEDVEKLFHYTNLQPLWWHENMSKGGGFKISHESVT